MAHLLLLRTCKSFTYSKDANYGTHEKIEREIAQRKYPLNDVREGYNRPFASEWHFMDYRVKQEVIPQFASDLQAINLNPIPNNMTLYKVFSNNLDMRSVNKLFKIIQWCFKWINRKKITSVILFIISILTLQLWLWIVIALILINPVKPVQVAKGDSKPFAKGNWSYNFIYGQLEDPNEVLYNKLTNERYEQKDVL